MTKAAQGELSRDAIIEIAKTNAVQGQDIIGRTQLSARDYIFIGNTLFCFANHIYQLGIKDGMERSAVICEYLGHPWPLAEYDEKTIVSVKSGLAKAIRENQP